jgi:hypothetical protein
LAHYPRLTGSGWTAFISVMALRSTHFLVAFIVVGAALASCTRVDPSLLGNGGSGGGTGGSGGTTTQPSTGLPCDIASTLQSYCVSCHAATPTGGAPMPLVTWDNLAATSPKGGTYGERSVLRMKDAAALMPPSGGVPAGEISGFEAWVTAGMAKGTCGGTGGTGGTGGSTGGTGGAGPATGIPCDVADVLKACTGCHHNPPSGGATMSLVTYDDLMATSPKGGTYADRCLVRMQDAAKPMPPSPTPMVSAAGIATFQAWATGGYAKGDCGTGGAGGGGDPYNTPDTCTSGVTWAGGEEDWGQYPKEGMHPGEACIDCHNNPGKYGLQDNGPGMWIGGTVYPTAHELKECLGIDGTQQTVDVEVTDANGQVVTLQANMTGNFYLRKGPGVPPIVYPITAKVVSGGNTRAMSKAVSTGDCNSCHTLKGANDAPGRIMAP